MIDIVVVNYRTPSDLQKFIDSTRFISVPHKLIVIEVDPLHLHHHPAADIVINHSQNIGYARACNHGSILGINPYIGFFNADTRFLEGAVETCLNVLESDDRFAIAGPRQIDDSGRITHAGIFGTLDKPMHRAWRQPDNDSLADLREAVTVSGSAYFIKRNIWDELTSCPIYQRESGNAEGAFLPTQHYYEETWCSYHAHSHGYKVMYVGAAKMIHLWHKASPVGGHAEASMSASREYFRRACEAHEIPHD